MPGEYMSPEFMAAYHAAVRGEATAHKTRRVDERSLEFLVRRWQASSSWTNLAKATQRQRANILKHVIETAGDRPYKAITRAHIIEGRERRAKTPSQANNFLNTIRALFRWAIEQDFVETDPTEGVRIVRRPKTGGFKIWTDDEIERFKERWPIGTRERLALELLRTTGLRRGDAAQLGRQHLATVDGVTKFKLRTEKNGRLVAREILPELAEAIAACPSKGFAFIATPSGRPMTKESFGNWFSEACRAAGVNKSAHGLRKVDATELVQAGVSEAELEGAMGWTPGSGMARVYTRERDDELLAKRAIEKRKKAKTETSYSQPWDRVGNESKKAQ
jgi:integrase